MPMDSLSVKGMLFTGKHGVAPHEKEFGNRFEVDVTFYADLSAPAKTDELASAIDYARVNDIAAEVMHGPSVNLIEHLAWLIGEKIAGEFSHFPEFEVMVRKLQPPVSHTTHSAETRLRWPR